MRRMLKPLLALTAGLALLVLSAAPSAASSGTITGGTISVNLNPVLTSSLGSGSGPCGVGTSTIAVTTSGSGPVYSTSTTLTINDSDFTYQGATYFLDATGANRTGTTNQVDTTPSPDAVTLNLRVNGQLYAESSPGSCTPSATPLCSGPIAVNLALSGSFTGTITPPNAVGSVSLSGSGPTSVLGCAAPFAALNAKTVTISGLTANLV